VNHITIAVNPQVELVQVLLYLSQRQGKTFQLLANTAYFSAIQLHFQPVKGHPAVKLTTALIDNNSFIHIRPLEAILQLDNITNDPAHPLHQWGLAVRDFADTGRFDTFFKDQQTYYSRLENTVRAYDIERWLAYTEHFFKKPFNRYNLILCPSAGNYGFVMAVPEPETAYHVAATPCFDEHGAEFWDAAGFAYGIAHEFGHCFVNPVVESHKDKLPALPAFFQSHANMLHAYNVDYAVMNEYFVRAYSVKFMLAHAAEFPDFAIEQVIERHRKTFIHIDAFIRYLDEYEAGGLSFEAFYLSVLAKIKSL